MLIYSNSILSSSKFSQKLISNFDFGNELNISRLSLITSFLSLGNLEFENFVIFLNKF